MSPLQMTEARRGCADAFSREEMDTETECLLDGRNEKGQIGQPQLSLGGGVAFQTMRHLGHPLEIDKATSFYRRLDTRQR